MEGVSLCNLYDLLCKGTVGILQSLKSQILYQKNPYTEVYQNEIRGKAPHNVAISYPETQRSTKNQKLASKVIGVITQINEYNKCLVSVVTKFLKNVL